MSCRRDSQLGAYVLGALEPAEARAVESHLAGCASCGREVGSLAATASMLSVLSRADAQQLQEAEWVADSPTATRPRPRRLVLLVAAAVLVAAASVGLHALSDRPPQHEVVQAVDHTTNVHASVTLTGHSWGTQLHLSLAGAYPSGRCSLVARSRDGRTDTAATWLADRGGAADVNGVTAIARSQLTELDVRDAAGVLLVRLLLPDKTN